MIKNIINSRWIVMVTVAIVTVIGGVTIVQAWVDNTLAPIGGTVTGPIVSGANDQTKTGNLTLGNDITIGQNSNISGNVQMAGGLKLNKNVSNCNLKVDGSGNVVCAGISATVTGPYDCAGHGGGTGGYCDIPGPASQQCFLTKIEAWDGDDMDGYECTVYYDSGKSKWRFHYWGDDIDGLNCSAVCIQ